MKIIKKLLLFVVVSLAALLATCSLVDFYFSLQGPQPVSKEYTAWLKKYNEKRCTHEDVAIENFFNQSSEKIKKAEALQLCEKVGKKCVNDFSYKLKGFQSYYTQSYCYYLLATHFLDEEFCQKITHHKVKNADSSYITPQHCRQFVQEARVLRQLPTMNPEKLPKIRAVSFKRISGVFFDDLKIIVTWERPLPIGIYGVTDWTEYSYKKGATSLGEGEHSLLFGTSAEYEIVHAEGHPKQYSEMLAVPFSTFLLTVRQPVDRMVFDIQGRTRNIAKAVDAGETVKMGFNILFYCSDAERISNDNVSSYEEHYAFNINQDLSTTKISQQIKPGR